MNKWLTSTVKTYTDHFGLSKSPVVYEVGSRDGKDGVELAQRIYSGRFLWKDSTIVLFECNPPQIEVIKSTYPNATLIIDAISDKKGTAEFLQINGDKNQIGSSSLNLDRAKEHWAKDNKTIKVKTRRLDDVIEELGHEDIEIDIMKVDIEHYTYEALVSLGKYLRNVKVFHVETEIEGVARNKTNLDVALFMQEKGYICTALENEWGEEIQDQVWVRG
jgi:FkbM family methyltransferase